MIEPIYDHKKTRIRSTRAPSRLRIAPYIKTAWMEALAPMDGGILYFLGSYVIRLLKMLVLLSVWRSIFIHNGTLQADHAQATLRYTLLASAFYQQLEVETTASTTFWEGTVSSRYLKPLGVFGQFIAETMGGWLPGLIFFTLPVLSVSPWLNIDLVPQHVSTIPLFLLSLTLGMMNGFAMDFIFTGLMVFLGNMHYFAYQIRSAVTVLLSGALIPLYLMPWGIGDILAWLPFASMASAPLQIMTGIGSPARWLLLQLVWCILLWPAAWLIWAKSKQRMVIFGG